MKLITLNTWAGRAYGPQIEFLKERARDTDIFCFQEVYHGAEKFELPGDNAVTDMYLQYTKLLKEFSGEKATANVHEVGEEKIPYGLALFVRKDIEVLERGVHEIFTLTEPVKLRDGLVLWNRLLQYVTIPYGNTTVTIFNLHGLYTGGGKDDESLRLEQSKRIRKFMNEHLGEKILCGDFNLNPNTESLAILEESMRNLIKENNVTCTRSHYYEKPGKFADYILVSPGISVKNFQVLQDVVSDHLPLMLEFE